MTTQALVECPNCNRLDALKSEHRHLDVAIELGMSCQHCKEWMHFGYYTPELMERRKELTNRRRERSFRRDFNKFQIEVEGVLNEAA